MSAGDYERRINYTWPYFHVFVLWLESQSQCKVEVAGADAIIICIVVISFVIEGS